MTYIKTDFDSKISVRSLNVREIKEFAILDLKLDDTMLFNYINKIAMAASNIKGIDNYTIIQIIDSIFKTSNILDSEDLSNYDKSSYEESIKKLMHYTKNFPALRINSECIEEKKDATLLLFNVLKSLQPNLEKLFKNITCTYKHLHIQPSELDNIPYWEFKYMLTLERLWKK